MGYVAEELKVLQEEFPNCLSNVTCGAQCGVGWIPILREVLAVLEKHGAKVDQIKEKFGGLRCYWDGPDDMSKEARDECWRAEKDAEIKSFTVCEACGAPGRIRNTGWVKTECNECYDERTDEANKHVARVRAKPEGQGSDPILAEKKAEPTK